MPPPALRDGAVLSALLLGAASLVLALPPGQAALAQAAWFLVGAPVAEELVFRAGLQSWLQARWPSARGTVAAVLLSSLLFSACHLLWLPAGQTALWALLTFFPSIVLGLVFARTRSLVACVALHAVFNAFWWSNAEAFHSLITHWPRA